MVQTTPINIDMIITNGIESMPSLLISAIYRLKNTFHLSGVENTLHINRQYAPKVCNAVRKNINLSYFRCKINNFSLIGRTDTRFLPHYVPFGTK